MRKQIDAEKYEHGLDTKNPGPHGPFLYKVLHED
jgi:hypothetical protein